MNAFLLPPLILAILFLAGCSRNMGKTPAPLAPTGLTLVVTKASGVVLDTVAVENDGKSRSVVFNLPRHSFEIRVFAIGTRIQEKVPRNSFFKGRPDNKTWMGLGYVKVHIRDGVLVGVDSNGVGPLEITEEMKNAIRKDLAEAAPADITEVEIFEGE